MARTRLRHGGRAVRAGPVTWEDFCRALIAEIATAEARGGDFRYYHAWLAAFERVLASRGAVRQEELEEAAFQFEFGERNEVFSARRRTNTGMASEL